MEILQQLTFMGVKPPVFDPSLHQRLGITWLGRPVALGDSLGIPDGQVKRPTGVILRSDRLKSKNTIRKTNILFLSGAKTRDTCNWNQCGPISFRPPRTHKTNRMDNISTYQHPNWCRSMSIHSLNSNQGIPSPANKPCVCANS